MLKIYLLNNTIFAEDANGTSPINPAIGTYAIVNGVFSIWEGTERSNVKMKSAKIADVTDDLGVPIGTEAQIHVYMSDKINFKTVSGGSGTGFNYTAVNYTDLTTVVAPTANEGDLAIVYNSQGVWLVNRKLKGVYMYQSGVWLYANQELQDILQAKVDSVTGTLVDNTDPLNPVVNKQWELSNITLGDFRTSGVSQFNAIGAGHLYTFGAGQDDEILCNINLNKDGIAYSGQNIVVDLFWQLFSAPAITDNVRWELDYLFANDGDDNYTDVTGTVIMDVAVGARTQRQQYTDSLPQISGLAGAKVLQLTLRRNGAGAGSDSFAGDTDMYGVGINKI